MGLRPPMCPTNLLPGKHSENLLNFYCICNYVDNVVTSWGLVGGRGRGWKVEANNRKPTHDFPMSVNTKFCSTCRRFAGIPISGYAPSPKSNPLRG